MLNPIVFLKTRYARIALYFCQCGLATCLHFLCEGLHTLLFDAHINTSSFEIKGRLRATFLLPKFIEQIYRCYHRSFSMNQLPEKHLISSTQIQPTVALISPRLATVGQFIAVVLIWSFTPLAAVWTVHEIHWAWGLFFRFSIAIPFAFICLFYFRLKLILNSKALMSYAAGAVGLFGSMTFCYMGATKVSSGIISIIYGTAPLWSGLIAVFILKREHFLKRQWYGLSLAIFGLCLTLGIGTDHIQLDMLGVTYEIIAVLLYVISMFSVAKIGADIHPIIQTTGSTLISWFGYLCLCHFFFKYTDPVT
jgi:hypothetical protein